jgi:WD40 repeat protein
MRESCWLLVWLLVPSLVCAEEKADQPILMLDVGGHTAPVKKVLFTPDGKRLITLSSDGTVRVWDVASGESSLVIRPPMEVVPNPKYPNAQAIMVEDMTLLGKSLVLCRAIHSGRGERHLLVVSLESGRLETAIDTGAGVTRVAVSPDGYLLAAAHPEEDSVSLWDARKWERVRSLKVPPPKGDYKYFNDLAFSPDGKRLAAAHAGIGQIVAVDTGRLLAALDTKTLPDPFSGGLWTFGPSVDDIAWSPDGNRVFAGGLVWKPSGEYQKDEGHPKSKWPKGLVGVPSPSGRSLAVRESGGALALYSLPDGSLLKRFAGRFQGVHAAAWSRDGQTIAWGTTQTATGPNAENPLERTFRWPDLEFGPRPDQTYRRWLLQAGPWTLRREDTQLRFGPEDAKIPPKWTMVLRKDGKDGLHSYVADGDRQASLLDEDHILTLGGGLLTSMRTDDHWDDKGDINIRTRSMVHWAMGGAAGAVSPAPGGRYILASWENGVLHILDPGRRVRPFVSLFVQGDHWVAWTPEGYYACSPGGEKLMGWLVNNGPDQLASFYPAEKFRKSLYRPDVIKRLLETGSLEKALALADMERGKSSSRTEVSRVLPPRVAITSPARSGQRVPKSDVEVRATAQSVGDHPVTALRLLLDGRPYEGQNGIKHVANPRLGEVSESWTVTLGPGRHRLAVQADSAVSKGESEGVEVIYIEEAQPDVELPSLYVLAVGVAAYPGDLKLNYAARDAQAIERTFKEKSKPLFKKIETKLLTDKEATQRGIKQGLTWLRKQMTQRDVGIFFYSGHGGRDSDGRFYLLPIDADPSDLLSTGVPDDDLKKALAGMPGRVLALLDACHAGAVGGDKRKAALTDDLVRDLVTDDFGVVVMCSAMGREFAQESNEHRQGYFTQALVEGLSGKADRSPDGAVYLSRLDAYVTDRVKELTRGQQHPVTAKPTSIRSFPLSRP